LYAALDAKTAVAATIAKAIFFIFRIPFLGFILKWLHFN
jgi:hypothetical protein